MSEKTISKTDISKKAIIVTQSIQKLLKAVGVTPSLRGDKPGGKTVVILKNSGKKISLHYYASERAGSGRTPEPRCWSRALSKFVKAGKTLRFRIIKALEVEVD